MADANYSNGIFTDAGSDSSRTDPITLASIVSPAGSPLTSLSNSVAYQAPLIQNFTGDNTTRTFTLDQVSPFVVSVVVNGDALDPAATPTPEYTVAGSVVTIATAPATGAFIAITYNVAHRLILSTGNYNLTGAQLTMTGGGATAASRFQIGPDSSTSNISSTVLVGYDNVAVPINPNDISHIINEDFILNFDDTDINNRNVLGTQGAWNYYIRNTSVLDVSIGNRMIVNIPRQGRFTDNLGGRNIFMLENNQTTSNIRMTINMGLYANDVLYSNPPSTSLTNANGGGPALANSTQLYELTGDVPVRDVLYRGDYVDWRPRIGSTTWASLTGGGFVSTNGIKWLIENQPTTIISDDNPLTFGNFNEVFELAITNPDNPIAASGNGYFELGISPAQADPRIAQGTAINRVVFRNVRGIDWNTRLGLWNNGRGRLRVEHQTVQPFHVFDDIQANVSGARIVLHHFYPTYAATDTTTPTMIFDRDVTSTSTSGTNGMIMIGADVDDYNPTTDGDNSTTTNRPIIIEALERNSQALGTPIQRDYRVAVSSTSVGYNNYHAGMNGARNDATYDAFAYGHIPSFGNGISFDTSSRTSGGPQAVQEVPLTRDMNITQTDQSMVPTRASTLENVYDMLQLASFLARDPIYVEVIGRALSFGSRRVVFNPSTETTNTLSVSPVAINIPCTVEMTAGPTGKFETIRTVPMQGRDTEIVSTGVRFLDFTEVGPNSPSISITGFNEPIENNNHLARIDVYDSTGLNVISSNRSLTYGDGTSRLLRTITADVGSDTFDRSDIPNMGIGGTVDTLTVVYSRPGTIPMVIDVDVTDATNRTVPITEQSLVYPIDADLTELGQPTWTATAAYTNNDTLSAPTLTATIAGGGTNSNLSDTQLNRLLTEEVFGSEHFNRFLFATADVQAMGSRNRNSYWFANSSQFQLAVSNRVVTVGYIDNTFRPIDSAPRFSRLTNIENQATPPEVVGQSGVFYSTIPAAFDLSAVNALTATQTSDLTTTINQVNTNVTNLTGDTTMQTTDDPSTLREIRTAIQTARNTIIGNL